MKKHLKFIADLLIWLVYVYVLEPLSMFKVWVNNHQTILLQFIVTIVMFISIAVTVGLILVWVNWMLINVIPNL